jgi:ATP-dependent protease Clp ATPase subunit
MRVAHLIVGSTSMTQPERTCSFCHQPQSKVEKLIEGYKGVTICNRCVALSYDVLCGEGVDMSSWRRAEPPKIPEDNK